ncbi:MAG: hypothetical protein ACFB02_19740 [Mastigocoleus sp.]
MNQKEIAIAWFPSILLLIVGLNHIFYLHPIKGVSKWKGGGIGVYCTNYEKRAITWVKVEDKFLLTKSTLYPHSKLYSDWFSYIPYETDAILKDYVQKKIDQKFILIQESDLRKTSKKIFPNKLLEQNYFKDININTIKLNAPVLKANSVRVHIWEYEYLSPKYGQWKLIKIVEESNNE